MWLRYCSPRHRQLPHKHRITNRLRWQPHKCTLTPLPRALHLWGCPHNTVPPGVLTSYCRFSKPHTLLLQQFSIFFWPPNNLTLLLKLSSSPEALKKTDTPQAQTPLQISSVIHNFSSLWQSLTHHLATAHFTATIHLATKYGSKPLPDFSPQRKTFSFNPLLSLSFWQHSHTAYQKEQKRQEWRKHRQK